VKSANYDVKCLPCGAQLGQILRGKFVRPSGGAAPLVRRGGMPCCCHCGGSAYLERIESQSSIAYQARLAKIFADETTSLVSA
jgi:hypothetical protein